jgi:hypothetical protein
MSEDFDEGFYETFVCSIITKGCNCPACACRHHFVCLRETRAVRDIWEAL